MAARTRDGRAATGQHVDSLVDVFRLLSDATRLRLVLALADVEQIAVNEPAVRIDRIPTANLARLALHYAARHRGPLTGSRITVSRGGPPTVPLEMKDPD